MLVGGTPVGVDYTDTAMGITLSLTQTRDCINIPITNDVMLDDLETFGVSLTTTSPFATVQVISSAVVTIQDPTIGQLPAYKSTITFQHSNNRFPSVP